MEREELIEFCADFSGLSHGQLLNCANEFGFDFSDGSLLTELTSAEVTQIAQAAIFLIVTAGAFRLLRSSFF